MTSPSSKHGEIDTDGANAAPGPAPTERSARHSRPKAERAGAPRVEAEVVPTHLRKGKGGPKTEAGRKAVRLNAVRHGITSARVPIPGLEDPAEWDDFREAVIDGCAPEGALEEACSYRIAETLWRLRRVAPYESEAVAIAIERVDLDFARRAGIVNARSVAEAQVRLEAAREALAALVAARAATAHYSDGEEPPDIQLGPAAANEAFSAIVERDPYMPTGEPNPFAAGCTATELLGVIGMLATKMGVDDPEAVHDMVNERMQAAVEKREEQLAYVVAERDRMRRERTLPAPAALIGIAKYEAHLNRQLSQTMNELETLQSRRQGAPTPLARIHFSAGA